MTPAELAKSNTEHAHQRALMAYCKKAAIHGFHWADVWSQTGKIPVEHNPVPGLEWFHAVHNQGHGDAIRGARAKNEGVKPGVADCFLPYVLRSNSNYIAFCGFYIEMKKPSVRPKTPKSLGGMSTEQLLFRDYVVQQGYKFATCWSWEEAVSEIKAYYGYKE